MEEKKNLCAPIPLSLHQRLRAEQEQRGQTLADYITDILNEHFEGGAKTMGNTNRTIAFHSRPHRTGTERRSGCGITTCRAAGVCLRLHFLEENYVPIP